MGCFACHAPCSPGDGINTGGQSRTPICQLPNVEHTEQTFPVLFLYRKELPDSGGVGQYRGGLSAESCFISASSAWSMPEPDSPIYARKRFAQR